MTGWEGFVESGNQSTSSLDIVEHVENAADMVWPLRFA